VARVSAGRRVFSTICKEVFVAQRSRSPRFVMVVSAALLTLSSAPSFAQGDRAPVRPESVREYVERTREWQPRDYLIKRSPDREQLQVYRVEMVGEQPAFIEGGTKFDVFFDTEDQRVVGERHASD